LARRAFRCQYDAISDYPLSHFKLCPTLLLI
jgi:hypothetical protein